MFEYLQRASADHISIFNKIVVTKIRARPASREILARRRLDIYSLREGNLIALRSIEIANRGQRILADTSTIILQIQLSTNVGKYIIISIIYFWCFKISGRLSRSFPVPFVKNHTPLPIP